MKITVIGAGPAGLYFALLAKKAWPYHEITVYERNRADDTFGFGVVFSDQTLGIFRDYDLPSYEAIRRNFAYWDDVDVVYQGHSIRCGGNGFCGCSRQKLLSLLQQRCRSLGVTMQFEAEIGETKSLSLSERFSDSDLIVAADGINSAIREHFKSDFATTIDLRKNYFCWLGSTRPLDAFKYFFRETPHGLAVAHSYQYQPAASTWVIELQPETWQGLGFAELDETESIETLEDLFAAELDGHAFIANRFLWRRFPTIRNRRWVKGNIVLLGDAKASAHYSIGSGTKLAMEDAIALFEALKANVIVSTALAEFEQQRRPEVEKTQYAAEVSLTWFENMQRYWDMPPQQFAFGVMSRSKQVTYDNLSLRDSNYIDGVRHWFVDNVRAQGFDVSADTPPMFTPFRLRRMVLPNRVMVSPMAQYSAVDGVPNDWHLVHYASRALGGAGLLTVEMTCPSPQARITPGCTGLWNDTQRGTWQRIVDFVHDNSPTKICMQLGHAGRKGSTQLGWQRMDHPLPENNWPLLSASAIAYSEDNQVPQAMTRDDMDEVINDFVRAAEYAASAGFDMLELHMAHGYLLGSFISPLTNQRQDEYGGIIENRMRFPLQVFNAMRQVWPQEKPMSVRISATDWHPEGLNDKDLLKLAAMLKNAGADLIDVSAGQTVPEQQPVYGRMFQVPFSDQIRNEVDIATVAVGNITTADQINTLLAAGRADLVALARPHLSDPYFTLHAAAAYGLKTQTQFWPKQYLAGRDQLQRLATQQSEELKQMRLALKPPSHAVNDDDYDSR